MSSSGPTLPSGNMATVLDVHYANRFRIFRHNDVSYIMAGVRVSAISANAELSSSRWSCRQGHQWGE